MDQVGLTKEADYIDLVIKKLSGYDELDEDENIPKYTDESGIYYDEGEHESEIDYFNSDQIVEKNMTEEEIGFLEALNNFISGFEKLKVSSKTRHSHEIDEIFDVFDKIDKISNVIENIKEMDIPTIMAQKSFERSISPVGSKIDSYTEGQGNYHNHNKMSDPDRSGPKPSSERKIK
jgi:hypothetical protein